MAHENVYPPSLHLDIFSLSSQPGIYFPLGTFFLNRAISTVSCLASVVLQSVVLQYDTWNEKQNPDLYGKVATYLFFSASQTRSHRHGWLAACPLRTLHTIYTGLSLFTARVENRLPFSVLV